ncbi:MAG: hypothetical protein B7Z53_01545 [Rhodospirillales bacterium 12-71-4]|nr:MAG: hypothetical protein B7Z53_01545 [Rhodospirillales bacterium 12-71-4]
MRPSVAAIAGGKLLVVLRCGVPRRAALRVVGSAARRQRPDNPRRLVGLRDGGDHARASPDQARQPARPGLGPDAGCIGKTGSAAGAERHRRTDPLVLSNGL